MARDLHVDTAAELQGEKLQPIGMVELGFDSGWVRLWSGIGQLTWNASVFEGVGTLGIISAIEETTEIRAVGVKLRLSGIPADVLAIALAEAWQGRVARVYYAVLEGRHFIGEPVTVFDGLMDQMTLVEGETASIDVACESKQIDLERSLVRRWTAEEQRAEFPLDRGLDAVAALQEVEILWGRS